MLSELLKGRLCVYSKPIEVISVPNKTKQANSKQAYLQLLVHSELSSIQSTSTLLASCSSSLGPGASGPRVKSYCYHARAASTWMVRNIPRLWQLYVFEKKSKLFNPLLHVRTPAGSFLKCGDFDLQKCTQARSSGFCLEEGKFCG